MRTDRLTLLVVALVVVGTLSGCNTVEGAGLDVSAMARTVGGWFGGRGY